MNLFKLFKKKHVSISRYKDYPEQPFISSDRDIKEWLKQAETFPDQSFVKREMMVRNEDGLLPGHIYMLYWLNKFTNKRIPQYFEYEYGIDFEKEVILLRDRELLDKSLKPTNNGLNIMNKYQYIIEKHNMKNKRKTTEEIYESAIKEALTQKQSLLEGGFFQYEYIGGKDSCPTCNKLDGQIFNINDMVVGKNAPPMHKDCRCTIAAHSDRVEWDRKLKMRGL
ncbi:minor capsid protein [Siminovitchia sp. FSL W7-1587]|uniref:minor capsid protein n=1 Tax=Siminovitchia sp. FSL W7-1587 TaxID=2954699 RepID=UPI0030D05814